MTNIEHLNLPQMLIEPSAFKDSVLVHKRVRGYLQHPVVIFCSESVLNVIRILNHSDNHNEWDVEFVQSYMNRFL